MFMSFFINNNFTNFNTIVLHNYVDGLNCNSHTFSIIKEVSKIRYLGIIFNNNLG